MRFRIFLLTKIIAGVHYSFLLVISYLSLYLTYLIVLPPVPATLSYIIGTCNRVECQGGALSARNVR